MVFSISGWYSASKPSGLSLKTRSTRFLVFSLSIGLHGCATNPVTGKQDFVLMSESEELSLGRRYHQQIIEEMPVYPDQTLAAYVDQVGQRVAQASHRPALPGTGPCAAKSRCVPDGR